MSKEPKTKEDKVMIEIQEKFHGKIRTGEEWQDDKAEKIEFPPWPDPPPRPPKSPPPPPPAAPQEGEKTGNNAPAQEGGQGNTENK